MTDDLADHPAEPPVQVTPDGVDPTPRRIGHRWLDLIVALSAILISLTSLAVAIDNSRTERRLVAASSWPMMSDIGGRNMTPGQETLSLTIGNRGVGPAVVVNGTLLYRGQPVSDVRMLLLRCCGVAMDTPPADYIGMGVAGDHRITGVYRAGDKADVLVMRRTETGAAVWDRLNQAEMQGEIGYDICYCSVLRECWRSNLVTLAPLPVEECHEDPAG